MIVDAPAEFWDWLATLADAATQGNRQAQSRHDLALALLSDLYDLRAVPDRDAETAHFARVRESKRHPIWRISAQVQPDPWVRLLCAFPSGTGAAVIVCPTGDQSRIGDPFYRPIAGRTDALVEHWMRDRAAGERRMARGLTRGFESADAHIAAGMAASGAAERIAALRSSMKARDEARTAEILAARRTLHTQMRAVRV